MRNITHPCFWLDQKPHRDKPGIDNEILHALATWRKEELENRKHERAAFLAMMEGVGNPDPFTILSKDPDGDEPVVWKPRAEEYQRPAHKHPPLLKTVILTRGTYHPEKQEVEEMPQAPVSGPRPSRCSASAEFGTPTPSMGVGANLNSPRMWGLAPDGTRVEPKEDPLLISQGEAFLEQAQNWARSTGLSRREAVRRKWLVRALELAQQLDVARKHHLHRNERLSRALARVSQINRLTTFGPEQVWRFFQDHPDRSVHTEANTYDAEWQEVNGNGRGGTPDVKPDAPAKVMAPTSPEMSTEEAWALLGF